MDTLSSSETEGVVTQDEFVPEDEAGKQLDDSLTTLGLTPIKATRLRTTDRIPYAKRKLKQMHEHSKELLSVSINVPASSMSSPQKDNHGCTAENDLDTLLAALKKKLEGSTKAQKISLLTLAPESWSITKTATEFGVTEYIVRRSRELKNEQGILPDIVHAKGKPISQQTVKDVTAFYNEDDISRMMPGSKDYKSVKEGGIKLHKQRRLLLMNLNEAYTLFKTRHPGNKIGISKFCALRPKECVTVGARGTHSVCVCTIHQNVKLMLASFPQSGNMKLSYHDLLQQLVCSVENSICMLHRCEACPGSSALKEFLESKVSDEVDTVKYKQWESTDRTTLIDHVATVDEYTEVLVSNVEKLAEHHFISKHQSEYLRKLKETITNECIILLDFAENYSFIVQDAAQGYHWDNSQCTLHPFVVYYRAVGDDSTNEVKCLSLCVVSDCLKHDTVAVHTFLSHIIPIVLSKCPHVSKVIYFSDGAASQYKNYKNFRNLAHHVQDFNVQAEWHFFATSHGKSPCDGIGGTVKRAAARASLQATTDNYIMTPADLFSWAERNIKNIQFIWVDKGDVEKSSERLASRFESPSTVPGTRGNHCFIPVGTNHLEVSRVSGGPGFTVDVYTGCKVMKQSQEEVSDPTPALKLQDMIPGKYISCMYDREWWIGNIKSVDHEENDVQVSFMHPHGPNKSFSWPRKDDVCWVPLSHVLDIINAPVTTTGRRYTVPQETQNRCTDELKNIK